MYKINLFGILTMNLPIQWMYSKYIYIKIMWDYLKNTLEKKRNEEILVYNILKYTI
jgi:hypothetical protein